MYNKLFFFLCIKILTRYFQQQKKKGLKKACEKCQGLSEEEKTSINKLMNNIEIFLKKKKQKIVSVVVSTTKSS